MEPAAARGSAQGELQEHPVPLQVPPRGQQAGGEEQDVPQQPRHCDNTQCGE